MALFDFLFGKKSPLQQLEGMSAGELEREQLRLEAQQDAIIGKVKTLEKRKDAVLKEGAKKKSGLERKAMAVRYKQVDAEARDFASQANLVSKQIRVISRMCQLKRREKLLKQEGLWSTITSVDAAELDNFMIDMRAKRATARRPASSRKRTTASKTSSPPWRPSAKATRPTRRSKRSRSNSSTRKKKTPPRPEGHEPCLT